MLTDTRAMTLLYFRLVAGWGDDLVCGTLRAAAIRIALTQTQLYETERLFPQLEGVGISHSWFG